MKRCLFAERHSAQAVLRRDDGGLPTVPGHPRLGPGPAQPPHDRGRIYLRRQKSRMSNVLSDVMSPVLPGRHPLHEPVSLHGVAQHPHLTGVQPVQDHGPATPASGQRCWGGKSWFLRLWAEGVMS